MPDRASIPDAVSRRIELGGVPLRWEERGEGPPVVFVHGIPTSPALWRKVIPRIARGRCLAFEMAGYGESIAAGRDRDISVGRQADLLLAWIRELGIDRAVLVGHDLGGGVVHIAATREPSVAAGLLLTNAIGYDSWPIPSVKIMRAMGGVLRHLPSGAMKAMLGSLFIRGHDDWHVARESRDIHWAPYARTDGSAALIRQIRSLDVSDTLAVARDLPKLRGIPGRIVWGAADPFQTIEYGERFARDLGLELVPIEGGKHFTPEDHPDVIAESVEDVVAAAFARELEGRVNARAPEQSSTTRPRLRP
ncbi:MAG: alpha/beta fold hydrolase [Thermoanaerobaculia bacterium]